MNTPDPSDAPGPTLAQHLQRFVEAGNKIDDFTYPVAITPSSLTYAVAKRIGTRMNFPTSLVKIPKTGDLSPELLGLVKRINITAIALGIPGIPQNSQTVGQQQ